MTFFSHRPRFSDFSYLFKTFQIFAACNVVYHPFFTRKTPISENNSLMTLFFTMLVLSHAYDKHYFSPVPLGHFRCRCRLTETDSQRVSERDTEGHRDRAWAEA